MSTTRKQYVLVDRPIWESPVFGDLMLDSFIEPVGEGKGTFVPAAEFLLHTLQTVPTQCLSWLPQLGGEVNIQLLVALVQGLVATVNALPARSKSEEKFLEFLSDVKTRVSTMVKGTVLLFPGGWIDDNGDHVLLYVLERKNDGYAFGVCNNGGAGVEYHPLYADSVGFKYRLSVVIDDIPPHRMVDSSFWYMLFKMQVWPSVNNTAQFLYETLLPFLNGKPLNANLRANAEGTTATTPWQYIPRAGDSSLASLLMEGMMLCLSRKGFSERHCSYLSLLIRWQLCLMVFNDLGALPKLTDKERNIVKNIVKQTAIYAAQETRPAAGAVITTAQLTQVLNFLNEMEKRLAGVVEEGSQQFELKETPFSPFPLFESFVREENVERYAGPAEIPPMFRPVELTMVPDKIYDFNQLANALRQADNVSLSPLTHQAPGYICAALLLALL